MANVHFLTKITIKLNLYNNFIVCRKMVLLYCSRNLKFSNYKTSRNGWVKNTLILGLDAGWKKADVWPWRRVKNTITSGLDVRLKIHRHRTYHLIYLLLTDYFTARTISGQRIILWITIVFIAILIFSARTVTLLIYKRISYRV